MATLWRAKLGRVQYAATAPTTGWISRYLSDGASSRHAYVDNGTGCPRIACGVDTSISLNDIIVRVETARRAIAGAVYRTPLEPSLWLSERSGAHVSVKLECYQPTGSFKVRGALAATEELDYQTRALGVVTASAGNHGLGVAYAASRAGIRATVVVPEGASPAKLSALRRFPVTVQTAGPSYDTAEREARSIERDTGAHFISPYNDPWVIAGQGTIGAELLEDLPDLDVAVVPVGGGGLISGIGAWLKAARPGIRLIGVQSVASPAMERAIAAGRLVEIPILPTLADGLAANIEPGSVTFDIARHLVDEMVLVSEDEIVDAVREAYDEMHLALEASAVVGIAALRARRIGNIAGNRVALVVTGRNIAAERLCSILGEHDSGVRGTNAT